MMRSEFCTPKFAALLPIVPYLPKNSSWSFLTISYLAKVPITGIFKISISFRNSSLAPASVIPLPTMITGRLAAFNASRTCGIFVSNFGASGISNSTRSASSTIAPCISSGTSSHTGPGLPCLAS